MAEITVLQLMDMIEQDESIRNYQSRWRELRSLLEKQAEVASQQSVQADANYCECKMKWEVFETSRGKICSGCNRLRR